MSLWQLSHLHQLSARSGKDSILKASDWLCGCHMQNMKKGLPMLIFDRERSSRIGMLRKDATSEMGIRWFKLPAMYAYHVANAWQEVGSHRCPDKIRIFLCAYDNSVSALYTTNAAPHWQGSKIGTLLSPSPSLLEQR